MKKVLFVLAILVTSVTAKPVAAAPRCPNGGIWTPTGCVYQKRGMTCAWPLRLVKVGNVTMCVKWAVQP